MSRVDRLFRLLQEGQNAVVRETAAQQIGEIIQIDSSKANELIDSCLLYTSPSPRDRG